MEPNLSPISIEEINAASPVEIVIQPDGEEPDVSVELSPQEAAFDANLAEEIDATVLATLSSTLMSELRIDKTSRRDWEKTVTEGMELLGMRMEDRTEPWKGACGVFHSIMSEAVIKFQSEMVLETFPATGPVHTKVIGKSTKDKEDAAARVKTDMNWQLTENMCEYRSEHERMLWNLAFAGAAFKKVYYDPAISRQVAMFVPAEDVYLPYGANESYTPRLTQVMRKTEDEIRKLMDCGFYRDTIIQKTVPETNDIEKKKQKLSGQDSIEDDRITLYEVHTKLCISGLPESRDEEASEGEQDLDEALPYVVTLDTTGEIYSIYRNWKPDDADKKARQHFVHYVFIPGFGSYGFGYVHILGGYAKGATSILRQLVDAGTLANLPGGLKARGLRIKGDDTPIMPGEFRDVDVPAGTIRDNIVNLPYKEPSQTLLALFKEVVDEGRSLASTADMKVADMNQQAPVGTTLAIIERMMKVMSAVQARVHAAMKKEFKILKEIIRDYTPSEYTYDPDSSEGRMVKQSDYQHCDIIPVSDPNASSSVQRMAQYQAALQLSQSAPQIYDMSELHRASLTAMGMRNADKIIPDKDAMKPKDPISENMGIVMMKPVKAFQYQDHDAHILVHMSAAQDPKMQQMIGQNPQAPIIQQALQAHLMEHMAYKYRADIEQQMGVQLPAEDGDEEMPEEIELRVSRLAAEAAPQILQMHSQQAAQEAVQQQMQDPAMQQAMEELKIEQAKLDLKRQELQAKAKQQAAEFTLKQKVAESKDEVERLRIVSQERIAGVQVGAQIAGDHRQQHHQKNIEGFKAGIQLRSASDKQGGTRPPQK